MKKYRIHLIRHGLTSGNLEGRYIGITDVPLSQEGMDGLYKLRENYTFPDSELIFTSPLLRCIQTANILFNDREFMISDDLKECNFGDFEGKSCEELQNNTDFAKWLSGDAGTAPPNGESTQEFINRCVSGFSEIAEYMMKTGTETASVITHGGVIMAILSSLAYPRKKFNEWITSPGSGYTISISPQLWMSGSIVEVIDYVPLIPQDQEIDYTE